MLTSPSDEYKFLAKVLFESHFSMFDKTTSKTVHKVDDRDR